MIINLKEAEKTALANHLAEKSVEQAAIDADRIFPLDAEFKERLRKKQYKFFKNILNETNDY
jgi:hypothetical protein